MILACEASGSLIPAVGGKYGQEGHADVITDLIVVKTE